MAAAEVAAPVAMAVEVEEVVEVPVVMGAEVVAVLAEMAAAAAKEVEEAVAPAAMVAEVVEASAAMVGVVAEASVATEGVEAAAAAEAVAQASSLIQIGPLSGRAGSEIGGLGLCDPQCTPATWKR